MGRIDQENHIAYDFTPDGCCLLIQNNMETCACWDLATKKVRWQVQVNDLFRGGHAFSPDGRALAYGTSEGEVVLLELATVKERLRLRGHLGWVKAVAFSPDGKRLASGGRDTTILLWNPGAAGPTDRAVRREQLDAWWSALGGEDAPTAYRAICGFTAFPDRATSYLSKRLHKPTSPNEGQLKQWLAQLDDDKFEIREVAARELTKLGKQAEPALHRVLAGAPTVEVRRRVQTILDDLQAPFPRGEDLASVRAVEVLERIATPEAERLLKEWADGTANALRTKEAKIACERLGKRRATR